MNFLYTNRDISWLSFNERVLDEADAPGLPIMESINFLSIFSSNLDEFYRVRMPALQALTNLQNSAHVDDELVTKIDSIVDQHQERYGQIIKTKIVSGLKDQRIELIYEKPLPSFLKKHLATYFLNHVASFIRVVDLVDKKKFFPENNRLYLLVVVQKSDDTKGLFIINIPTGNLPRFYSLVHRAKNYIVFLDDIIRNNVHRIIPQEKVLAIQSFKVTRSGELDIEDEFEGDIAAKIENELKKRDLGMATRFLHETPMKKEFLKLIKKKLGLRNASIIKGGRYHNLHELRNLPLRQPEFYNKPWKQTHIEFNQRSIFDSIKNKAFLLHTPYHSFDPLLRFFNEASLDKNVIAIYTTIYRIAKNSMIAHALTNAAKNGKKVRVFVELKARFDEDNNLKWARKMEDAGVKIIFSIPALKVHSKVALVKRMEEGQTRLYGILGTGNFHENNAALYSDHYLFTSDSAILSEVGNLFNLFRNARKGIQNTEIAFEKLLVGQFNLRESFIQLIENEIDNARQGIPASIIIKVNNLEDRILINKLYIASGAGVKIFLLVRGICCLVPGVQGISSNIKVTRIVDRYLEHGRVFIFNNHDRPLIYLGSSDWMTRNMDRRVEVCVPIKDDAMREEIIKIINMQLSDNQKAVTIDAEGRNKKINKENGSVKHQSQKEISGWIAG